jgi:HTH-type transcriptional regulator, transcriptional repressor of NAD biosynthesis genes
MINITQDIIAPITEKKIRHGLVFGKFMPPTNGHMYLLDFARASCDKLTIIVLSLENEPIPGELRFGWIQQMYPDCTVIHHTADMPQEPKDAHDVPFYHAWRDTIHKHCPATDFDALFASETYGYQVAWALGIRFIPVNTARDMVQISGTKMRHDPWLYWDELPVVVRPYFLKHIGIVGGTAEARNTLARQLAQKYKTRYVADYAQTLQQEYKSNVLNHTGQLQPEDIATVMRGFDASAAALGRQANRILFYDADHYLQNTTAPWPAWHILLVLGADTSGWAQKAKAANMDYLLIADMNADIDLPLPPSICAV